MIKSPFRTTSFAARDEDASQSLTYSLTNDDNGRFRVDSQGNLYKAKDVDYETQTTHVIRAMVQDSGNPSMKVRHVDHRRLFHHHHHHHHQQQYYPLTH